jgi:hypothetical protein
VGGVKPEIERVSLAEIERKHPQVMTPAELEPGCVYVLQSGRFISTWNYMGVQHLQHAVTLDAVALHHFHGPRVDADVFIQAKSDGTYIDSVGTRIVVRKWMGED